jgi:hypothetical protein
MAPTDGVVLGTAGAKAVGARSRCGIGGLLGRRFSQMREFHEARPNKEDD